MRNGIHQLLWPRLISSNVFEGAVKVLVKRCHLRQARSHSGRGLNAKVTHVFLSRICRVTSGALFTGVPLDRRPRSSVAGCADEAGTRSQTARAGMKARLPGIVPRNPNRPHHFPENAPCSLGPLFPRSLFIYFPGKLFAVNPCPSTYQTQPYPAGYLARRPERLYTGMALVSPLTPFMLRNVYIRSCAGSTCRDIGRRVTGCSGEGGQACPSQNRPRRLPSDASGRSAFGSSGPVSDRWIGHFDASPPGCHFHSQGHSAGFACSRAADLAARFAGAAADLPTAFPAQRIV